MLYRGGRAIARLILWLMRVKVTGAENLPREGGVLVCANHVSYWDPVVIGCLLNRPINFMAKAEFFENRFSGAVFRGLRAFPVKRGSGDRQAIRRAMELLQAGEVVGIFPEGSRNQSGELLKPQLGTAMIAAKTGSPVLPVACVGGRKRLIRGWFRPRELRVGQPITMERYQGQKVNSQALELISTEIVNGIDSLL
ncbi:MAG: lysophospholipid acyltransferase family protein [Syntrophomonadaceae bacterium]|nr:lysophospholipid acyltransferase family protein [Syntrophomonadaceae bacterium]